MTVTSFSVPDIHCDACAARIERALSRMASVQRSRINTARQRVYVSHDDRVNPLQILEALEAIGFHPTLGQMPGSSPADKKLLKRLGVAGLAAMQVMAIALALYIGEASDMITTHRDLLRTAALTFTLPVVLYSAAPFFRGAWDALLQRQLGMDVPVALAIAVAFTTSAVATVSGRGEVYFDSVVMFTFLLLTARFLDNRLRGRLDASASILRALPERCTRLVDGELEEIDRADIQLGDVLWITPDNRVPADGSIDTGRAWLDESMLTGESQPIEKRAGARVYAGTLVIERGLQMLVDTVGDDTRLATIEAIASRAELDKPRIASISDRVARVFIAAILACAALTFLGWLAVDAGRALPSALAVLVISCPCALSLAIPAAVTAALVRSRSLGGVVFNSGALGTLAKVDELLIDKTGTLTTGTPAIEAIVTYDPHPDRAQRSPARSSECLAIATAMQRHSSHPLARAFDGKNTAVVNDVRNVPGRGVEAVWEERPVRLGNAEFCGADDEATATKSVYLSIGGAVAARFDITERLRGDATAALAELRQLGIQARIASGDSESACRRVAEAVAIPFEHSQTPEAKLAIVDASQRAGRRVLAIGDGINDVPLLAAADISIAVLETPDAVRERADILLLTRNLSAIPALVRTARKTARVIRQNLRWALLYNLVAIPLAAFGFVPPWLAAVGMSASSLTVMINATRVLRPDAAGRPPGTA